MPQDEDVAIVWSAVTIDCRDPVRVARFWAALLGREPGPSQDGWVYLGHRGDPQPRLVFQPVPEPAQGEVRIHLDVTVDDIGEALATVERLGGHFTGERHDHDEGVVLVMADPEGHEFCLVQYFAPARSPSGLAAPRHLPVIPAERDTAVRMTTSSCFDASSTPRTAVS
jgi:predicted enzyme related to lactoylglutathione lyase